MSLHSPYLDLCIICWNYPACSNIVHAGLQLFVKLFFCHASDGSRLSGRLPGIPGDRR